MPRLDGLRVHGWLDNHLDLVLELVCNILAILDTNILMDLLLGNLHGVGSSVPAIVENVPFELLTQANLCCLGFFRISRPVADSSQTALTVAASATIDPSFSSTCKS